MSGTLKIQRELERINAEIEALETRQRTAHGLGDSNSTQGISSNFANNIQWQRRLDALYIRKDRLESILNGESTARNKCINTAVFKPL